MCFFVARFYVTISNRNGSITFVLAQDCTVIRQGISLAGHWILGWAIEAIRMRRSKRGSELMIVEANVANDLHKSVRCGTFYIFNLCLAIQCFRRSAQWFDIFVWWSPKCPFYTQSPPKLHSTNSKRCFNVIHLINCNAALENNYVYAIEATVSWARTCSMHSHRSFFSFLSVAIISGYLKRFVNILVRKAKAYQCHSCWVFTLRWLWSDGGTSINYCRGRTRWLCS